MQKRIVTIFTNDTAASKETEKRLIHALESGGFTVSRSFSDGPELIICVGGDGAFLKAIHLCGFPATPFIGINTGHLGFFQELSPDQLDAFLRHYKDGKYRLQPLSTVKASVKTQRGIMTHIGLNEIVIKGDASYLIHLDISIDGSFIERFSGDGILVATPAGSTAYNYSLGGAIVDPRLKLLQITPIAPMNTTAYRSFTSSILLPADLSFGVVPEYGQQYTLVISTDGIETRYDDIESIDIRFADQVVNLLRFESYDFWNKVKTKFLDDRAAP